MFKTVVWLNYIMLNLFKSKRSNSIAVVYHLLKILKVNANYESIKTYLESHPEFPSILAISDYLASISIKNQSFVVEKTGFELSDIITPFIAHLSLDGGKFIVLNNVSAANVYFIDEMSRKVTIPISDFLKIWTGVILLAEADQSSGEKGFKNNRRIILFKKLRIPAFIISTFTVFILISNPSIFHWPFLSLLAIKFIGTLLTCLLIAYNFTGEKSLLHRVCKIATKSNCLTILQSDAAKVTSWLSWSEIGLFYFISTFLILLTHPEIISLLNGLNVLALPFTMYSFSYQYKKKSWCPFCLFIQLLLIAECLIFNLFFPFNTTFYLTVQQIMVIISCITLPISTWYLSKPVLMRAHLLNWTQKELDRFKYDEDYFNLILHRQRSIPDQKDLMPVTLGTNKSIDVNIITVISSPYCKPCSYAHSIIKEWVNQRDDLIIQHLFLSDGAGNNGITFARHMTALGLLGDEEMVLNALSDWYDYGFRNYSSWALNYPVVVTEEIILACNNQKIWFDKIGIIYTPTIIVNGYQLPEQYQLNDLKYLIK